MDHLRPNFVWISLEDTSPRFGCYGDALARTPNIDRLAAEGAVYTNAFSTAGVCAPSRSAIITGMYQTSIGTMHMRTTHTNEHTPELPTPYQGVPPAYVKAFTEYMRTAGYYCTNNSKTDYQFEAPFTAWDECGTNAHWRNREAGQPFFAVFNPTFTHESGMWMREDEQTITDPDAVVMPPYLPDTLKSRKALARHYDNIEKADQFVGNILSQLEDDGLLDQTAVFLWSDHGEGLPRAKRWPYDAGIRVPLIVRCPSCIQPGQASDRMVSLVDLAPAILGLAGVQAPAHLQGQSFLDTAAAPREYIYAARDRFDEAYDMVRAVRDRRYKYIRHYYPYTPYLQWIPYSHRHPIFQEMWRLHHEGKLTGDQAVMMGSRPAEELYDCEEDPHELRNLADEPAHLDTIRRLRSAMDAWRNTYGDLGDIPEAQMVRNMWPDGVQPVTAKPIILLFHEDEIGLQPVEEAVCKQEASSSVMIHCATQGASIAYTFDEGEDARWRLYTSPIRLEAGARKLRAKSIRIGYKESEETEIRISYRV